MKKFAASILILIAGFIVFCLAYSCTIQYNSDPPQSDSLSETTLCVTNQTDDTVDVWLTISIFTDTLKNYYVQDVNGIFGITTSGGSGTFVLAPGDSVFYKSELAFSGNLCFGGPALNCPTDLFPTGTNIFEFTINNQAIGKYPQESVEISCVAGVNSYLSGKLSQQNWIVTTGIDSIQHFHNDTLGNNRNRYGVFPTGCTNCTNQSGAPVCVDPLTFEAPNELPICIIQRPANLSGGMIYCTFHGFTN